MLAAVAPAVASPLADAVTLCAAADRAPLAEKRALLELGRVLEARGERDEARAALRRALADAERAANADVAAEARRLLTRLGG